MGCLCSGGFKKKSNSNGNSAALMGGGGHEKKLHRSGNATAPTVGGQHEKACNGEAAYTMLKEIDSWILDSGCTTHSTSRRELFISFKAHSGVARLADDSAIETEGIGDIVMKMHDGASRLIKDVYYKPKLCCNLISESRLDDRRYDIVTHNGEKVVKDGDKVVMKCIKKSGLYYVQGDVVINATADQIQEATNSVL